MENFSNKLYSHKNVISNAVIDSENKLIASSGWDGQIIIQAEDGKKRNIKKQIKKANEGKPISIMKVWVEDDTLATVSYDTVYIWSYESMKSLGSFSWDGNEILTIEFILNMPFIMTLGRSPIISIWSLNTDDRKHFCTKVASIDTGLELGDQLSNFIKYVNYFSRDKAS